MGFERRIFARTDVEVQGHLVWQTKRRIGGLKTHTAPVQTVDLSVDGAKVLVHNSVELPIGASVRLMFHDESSPARVRHILTNDEDEETLMLRLQLENPPAEFMRLIDQWLDANKGGRKFVESGWFGSGIVDDLSDLDFNPHPHIDESAA